MYFTWSQYIVIIKLAKSIRKDMNQLKSEIKFLEREKKTSSICAEKANQKMIEEAKNFSSTSTSTILTH